MAQQENGPKVKVEKGLPGINVRVTQSYRAGDDVWRGMVTIAFQDTDMLDIEGSVKEGKNGKWFAPPSRSYEDRSGNTKWKNLVWFNDASLAAACTEAVMRFVNDDAAPVDDDDIPL